MSPVRCFPTALLFILVTALPGQKPELVIQTGHSDVVQSVAFSPDGQYVLTGSSDNTVKLWNLEGQELLTFTGHSGWVNTAIFSPDGQFVLTGSWDETARLWDLSGREIQRFSGHTNHIEAVAFSPDGQYILTGSQDRTAKLWDRSGRELQSFSGHDGVIWSVAFSPDGQSVLTGGSDNHARLWNLRGKELLSIKLSGDAMAVAFSPDGNQLLIGLADGTARLFDRSGRELLRLEGHAYSVRTVAFSQDGQTLLTASHIDETIKHWDLTGRELQSFTVPLSDDPAVNLYLTAVAFSPDGQQVLMGGEDAVVKLLDPNGRELRRFDGQHAALESVAFSGTGSSILTGGSSGAVRVLDLMTNTLQQWIGHDYEVASLAGAPDDQYVLTTGTDGAAVLWDPSGREVHRLNGHAFTVTAAAFSPDGQYLLTGGEGRTAKLWDLEGRERHTFRLHREGVNSVAFSPDGRQILTGSKDDAVRLWARSGELLQQYSGLDDDVQSVAFSADGQRLLAASSQTVRSWDRSGRQLTAFPMYDFSGYAALLSPDGQYILTTVGKAEESVVELWDARSGVRRQEIAAPEFYPSAATFSADGRNMLVGGEGSVKAWDLSGREWLAVATRFENILEVGFSADGERVLTGSTDENEIAVEVFDRSGRQLHSFTIPGDIETSFAFSPDGLQVLTADWEGTTLWDLEGRQLHTFSDRHGGGAMVTFSPDGQYILSAYYDRNLGLWDRSGRQLGKLKGYKGVFRSVAFSPDGQYLLIAGDDDNDNTLTLLNVNGRRQWQLEYDDELPTALGFSADGREVFIGFLDGVKILRLTDGREVGGFTSKYWGIRASAFSPDGRQVLIGGYEGTARLLDLSGREVHQLPGHLEQVSLVAFSPNGQHLLTGDQAGVLRLWDRGTGQLLATVYNFKAGDGWVVTTPDGRFDGNDTGFRFLHYRVGLEVVELDRLKERYYEPGLLAKILGWSAEPKRNVAAFDQVDLYPEVQLLVEGEQLHIELQERSGGIGRVGLYIGDKEVTADVNPDRQRSITVDLNTYREFFPPGATRVGVKAWNAADWLPSELITVGYTAPGQQLSLNTTTRLYALCIGTSNYQGEGFDLRFAEQDAAKMAEAIALTGRSLLYDEQSRVEVELLSTSQPLDQWPSKDRIRQALGMIAEKARPEDLFILYLAGHGTTSDRDGRDYFYYLTHELNSGNITDSEVRRQFAISTAEFAEWLNAIPAQKQVLMLDACASGTFNESFDDLLASRNIPPSQVRALDRLRSRTGLFIISGSTADQVSYEASPFGQGLLTYSLLRGIQSGEALREGEYVDVLQLFNYSKEMVPELARQIGGIQQPMILTPYGAESYDIGRATAEARTRIRLSEPKPVFSRVRLSNELTFDDDLGLEKVLNDQLRDVSKMAPEAELIFVDVPNDPNAYRIVGSYTVEGAEVIVKARLLRRGQQLGREMMLRGPAVDLPDLGRKLLAMAHEQVAE